MPQSSLRRSMTVHRYPTAQRGRHNHSAGVAEAGALLTMLQVCVCVITLVVVFTLQFLDEARYARAGELYRAAMSGGEGEAVFVMAVQDYARQLWDSTRETADNLLEPNAMLVSEQLERLGQGGQQSGLPANLYLGRVALMADPVYPVYGVVTSAFGYRDHPISGKADFHTGLDIAAPAQADIYSVLPGVVAETGESPIYGNYIKVEHGGGVMTVYNHCSVILAQTGTVVRRGQRIAQVGSTGISTGPHLHFDLLLNGCYAEPLQIFRGLGEKAA